jgi:hypothetical protein
MPAAQEKIITKLRERRQIEADLLKMLQAGSELEFRRQAQQIAALGSQVLRVIVGNLDRADARMLAAMGTVAAFLDRDEVTMALRQAVRQPGQSDRGRVSAMTILERFLGEPLDDDLLENLRDPEAVAVGSLQEVLSQVERNPSVLADYVQGLDRQEPDVVLAVIRALRGMGTAPGDPGQVRQVVEPLRAMAQDVRDEIAGATLEALGTLRHPDAARALQMLEPIVAPELRPIAGRLVRKLQFVGVKVEALPPPDPEWRVLASPVDGLGQQSVWFVMEDRTTNQARFLNVLLSDRAGAVEAAAHANVPARALPPRRSSGYVHEVALPDSSGAMLMLEASFDLGRRRVLDALDANRETQIPVAAVLRLLCPWLWGYAGADVLPEQQVPDCRPGDEAHTDRLLRHPAFLTWTARSDALLEATAEVARHPGWDPEVWVRRLADELFGEPVVARIFGRRLLDMSEWLMLAGEVELSRLALAAAQAIQRDDPRDQPFVQALIRRDLELVLLGLMQSSEPLFDAE